MAIIYTMANDIMASMRRMAVSKPKVGRLWNCQITTWWATWPMRGIKDMTLSMHSFAPRQPAKTMQLCWPTSSPEIGFMSISAKKKVAISPKIARATTASAFIWRFLCIE